LLEDYSSQKIDPIHKRKEIDLGGRVKNIEPSPSENIVKKSFEIHGKTSDTSDHQIAHKNEGDILGYILNILTEIVIHKPLDKHK